MTKMTKWHTFDHLRKNDENLKKIWYSKPKKHYWHTFDFLRKNEKKLKKIGHVIGSKKLGYVSNRIFFGFFSGHKYEFKTGIRKYEKKISKNYVHNSVARKTNTRT